MKKTAELLDFEAPLAILLKEIEALSLLPASDTRDRQIAQLRERVQSMRREIYAGLSPWQRVQLARHPNRPGMMDYAGRLFQGFTEIHGDRRFADDHAIVAGFATYHGRPVLVVGHQKSGADTKEKIFRNFGYAKPEGYRKALRAMRLAEKFHRPIVVLVDTPAAYPGIESEERGVAEAIAYNLREMAVLQVPVIVAICGEGGSGGALGLAVGDAVIIQEFAIYSVIPPEGCAAILWRDANRKIEAADALKLTAPDMLRLGIVDAIVPEPPGGAHNNREEAACLLDAAILEALDRSTALGVEERLERRYAKFRNMGRLGIDFVDQDNGERNPEHGEAATEKPERAGR
ncbi:MAG TPA: acetyl-CoA carboxylase carboxyltransferase subunit alpha [Vicinamibacterales bacterium]|nr:acetyl-CoA carboxylase carboxyltransferase subunit alpha [Vicinamibacterales bacterium]